MNELQIFSNEQFGDIRTLNDDGATLFCGADIARALGYTRPNEAVGDHCRGTVKRRTPTTSGVQEMLFIPEGDVYRLITHSKLPAAEQFEKWVFDEVLPTIRKHGMWAREDILANPDVLIAVATELKREQEARKALETERQTLLPKAEYYDALVDRNLMTNFRETAKLLDVPERLMIAKLVDAGFLFRNSRGGILPYAQRNRGYFAIKEYYNTQNGYMGVQTLVTFKGREKLLRMFNKAVA